MAKPDTKKGYFKFANEIADILELANFNKYEWRILWVIWRKTWGWKKKDCPISKKEFSIRTNISINNVSRTLKKLLENNVVYKKGPKNKIFIYGFQKDYENWKGLYIEPLYMEPLWRETVQIDIKRGSIQTTKPPKKVSVESPLLQIDKDNLKDNLKIGKKIKNSSDSEKEKIPITEEQKFLAKKCFKEDDCGEKWKNKKGEKCLFCSQVLKKKIDKYIFVNAKREKEKWLNFKKTLNI